MKKLKLLPRLILLTLVTVVTASCITALVYVILGPRTFANQRIKELQLSAELVSSYYLQYDAGEITLKEFERALSMSGAITDGQMQVFNNEGKLLIRSSDTRQPDFVLNGQLEQILESIAPGVLRVLQTGIPYTMENTRPGEIGTIRTICTPVYKNDHMLAVVALTMPDSQLQATFNGLVPVLLLAMIMASILVVFPVYFATKRITKPIQQMQVAATAMANGDFSIRADENAGGEIGMLASKLNALSEQLSETISQLTMERNRLWQILNGLAEGIIATDIHLQITHTNPAVYSLLSVEQGFTQWDTLPSADDLMQAFHQTIQSKTYQAITLSTERMIISVTLYPLIDLQSRCVGAVALFRDITEAERLEQTRREYVANVSHELRTPLSAVRGLTEALVDGLVKEQADQDRYYGYILHECMRLSRLIDDLLELSRLQSGTEAMEPQKINLPAMLEDIHMRYEGLAQEKGVAFEIEIQAPLPAAYANPDRVEQVMLILLDNAFKYTPENARVWVVCQ